MRPERYFLVTSFVPPDFPGRLRSAGLRLIHPFAVFYGKTILRDLGSRSSGVLQVPRNTPVHLRVLSCLLEESKPAGALHINPLDPREYLALLEAWRACAENRFEFHSLSLHSALPRSEKIRQLKAFVEKFSGDVAGPEEIEARCNVSAWQSWEENAWANGGFTPARIYLSCVKSALDGFCGTPPQARPKAAFLSAPGPTGSRRATGEHRVAIFGDWLLSRELFAHLGRLGLQVMFVQKAYDLIQAAPDHAGPAGWLDHFAAAGEDEKQARYRSVIRLRQVSHLLGVFATFSPERIGVQALLERFSLPCLILETPVPGGLTEQDKIRLEHFLFRG